MPGPSALPPGRAGCPVRLRPCLGGLDVGEVVVIVTATVVAGLFLGDKDFKWRRNSQIEPVFDVDGQPVLTGKPPRQKLKFYPVTHAISVSLERQSP